MRVENFKSYWKTTRGEGANNMRALPVSRFHIGRWKFCPGDPFQLGDITIYSNIVVTLPERNYADAAATSFFSISYPQRVFCPFFGFSR